MRRTVTAAIAAVVLLNTPLAAQRATGRLEGTVTEKLATRSASAAWIALVP